MVKSQKAIKESYTSLTNSLSTPTSSPSSVYVARTHLPPTNKEDYKQCIYSSLATKVGGGLAQKGCHVSKIEKRFTYMANPRRTQTH